VGEILSPFWIFLEGFENECVFDWNLDAKEANFDLLLLGLS
jgi:hypothetical protein